MATSEIPRIDPRLVGSRPAPGRLALVQAFVNSVDREAGIDRFADAAGVAGWVQDVGLGPVRGRLTGSDRDDAISLREEVRALIRSHDPVDGTGALEAGIARLALTVAYLDGGLRSTSTTALGRALGPVVDALGASMADGAWLRLKACERDRCQWLFFDSSRNQSSHWCTPALCGSREKARRAYARSRSSV